MSAETPSSVDRSSVDRLAQVHEQLAKAVEEIRSGEDWARMLAVQARFHSYSWGNCLLIKLACPEATKVCGYRTWQSLGRQVRRGERGIPILAPVVARAPAHDEENGRGDELDERRRVVRAFRVTFVWDISATDGEDLPEVKPVLLEGDAPAQLYERLAAQVTAAGYRLGRADCAPANGVTDFLDHRVTVRPDLPDAAATKTLAHELAHVHLHAELGGRELAGGTCRGRAEVEAESVAYLVCAMAGIESGSYSFPYVARWASDLSVVSETATRVTSCARAIAHSAGLQPEPELQLPAPARTASREQTRRRSRARRQGSSRSSGGRGR